MLKISGIHINYEKNPTGVAESPQFGWEIESDMRNVKQTSYRLWLAEDESFEKTVYDSGVVASEESAHVQALAEGEGTADGDLPKWMKSLTKYFVRVEITATGTFVSGKADGKKTDNGKSEASAGTEKAVPGESLTESAVSKTAWFITALVKEDWTAPFVSAETEDFYKERSKGTYVRGQVMVKKPLKEAYAVTTALGLYNFFLNGKKVGEDEMTPGWTSYQRHLLYQTYEVTDYLKEGANTAGAMLAAGWYKGVMGLTKARNNYGDRTGFSMELLFRYADGSEEWVRTDSSWEGADSPVIFSEIYDGEIYDSSLEVPGWAEAGALTGGAVSGERWRKTVEVPFDISVLRAQGGARVRMMDTLPCQEIIRTPKGERVLDFGQNPCDGDRENRGCHRAALFRGA